MSHLPQLSFLYMNGGDGTKISEESESTDETLAYDDDKSSALSYSHCMKILLAHIFERDTADDTLAHDYAREVIDTIN